MAYVRELDTLFDIVQVNPSTLGSRLKKAVIFCAISKQAERCITVHGPLEEKELTKKQKWSYLRRTE